jgi:hypothetical protein
MPACSPERRYLQFGRRAVDRALTTAKQKLPDCPPDLGRVIDLWAELPEALRLALAGWKDLPERIRAAILALVGTLGKPGE